MISVSNRTDPRRPSMFRRGEEHHWERSEGRREDVETGSVEIYGLLCTGSWASTWDRILSTPYHKIHTPPGWVFLFIT